MAIRVPPEYFSPWHYLYGASTHIWNLNPQFCQLVIPATQLLAYANYYLGLISARQSHKYENPE